MRRLAGLCASIIGVGALVGVLLAQGPADDVARAQTGMPAAPSAPGAAGTGAMMGGDDLAGHHQVPEDVLHRPPIIAAKADDLVDWHLVEPNVEGLD